MSIANYTSTNRGDGLWIIEIVLGICFLVALNYVLKHLIKRVRRRSLSKSQGWRENLEKIAYIPLRLILWILGIGYVLKILSVRFQFSLGLVHVTPLRDAAIVACVAWLILRWKRVFQEEIRAKYIYQRQAIDPGMAEVLSRLLSMGIILIASLVILQIIGLNIMPLVAFGGVGAAVIGFSAKDVMANFFGGLMVHITRPFTVGDLILLPDRKIEGTVETIGWYLTSIRDKDKRPVYLPNVFFSTLLVINSSRMSHRHFEETVAISYEDIPKMEAVVESIRKLIVNHPRVDKHLPMIVAFRSFGEYALQISIEAYFLTTKLDEFCHLRQEILLQVHSIIEEQGAQIPYPTSIIRQHVSVPVQS